MSEPKAIPTDPPTFLQSRLDNLRTTFTQYSVTDYIRLVAIIGAYTLIIRPLLMKLGAKHQEKDHAREVDDDGAADSMAATGVRQQVVNEGEESEDEEEEPSWGSKKRRDQRAARRRKKKEQEEGELDASDKEIEEFLVD